MAFRELEESDRVYAREYAIEEQCDLHYVGWAMEKKTNETKERLVLLTGHRLTVHKDLGKKGFSVKRDVHILDIVSVTTMSSFQLTMGTPTLSVDHVTLETATMEDLLVALLVATDRVTRSWPRSARLSVQFLDGRPILKVADTLARWHELDADPALRHADQDNAGFRASLAACGTHTAMTSAEATKMATLVASHCFELPPEEDNPDDPFPGAALAISTMTSHKTLNLRAIAKAIAHSSYIRVLELDNIARRDLMTTLSKIFAYNERIHTLLASNLGARTGMVELGRALESCKAGSALAVVNLSNNHMDNKSTAALVKGLMTCASLSSLDLSMCNISSKGIVNLFNGLESSGVCLQALNLSENRIGKTGTKALVSYLESKSVSSLATLLLGNASVDLELLAAGLSAPGPSATLLTLDISQTSVKSGSAHAMAAALSSSSITDLDLSFLKGSSSGLESGLSELVLAMVSQPTRSTSLLTLDGLSIGSYPSVLADALTSSRNLHSLSLEDASLSPSALCILANALCEVDSLRYLSVSRNIKTKSKDVLTATAALGSLVASIPLESLVIQGGPPKYRLGHELTVPLLEALEQSHSLTEIDLTGMGLGDHGAFSLARTVAADHSSLVLLLADDNGFTFSGLHKLFRAIVNSTTMQQFPLPQLDLSKFTSAKVVDPAQKQALLEDIVALETTLEANEAKALGLLPDSGTMEVTAAAAAAAAADNTGPDGSAPADDAPAGSTAPTPERTVHGRRRGSSIAQPYARVFVGRQDRSNSAISLINCGMLDKSDVDKFLAPHGGLGSPLSGSPLAGADAALASPRTPTTPRAPRVNVVAAEGSDTELSASEADFSGSDTEPHRIFADDDEVVGYDTAVAGPADAGDMDTGECSAGPALAAPPPLPDYDTNMFASRTRRRTQNRMLLKKRQGRSGSSDVSSYSMTLKMSDMDTVRRSLTGSASAAFAKALDSIDERTALDPPPRPHGPSALAAQPASPPPDASLASPPDSPPDSPRISSIALTTEDDPFGDDAAALEEMAEAMSSLNEALFPPDAQARLDRLKKKGSLRDMGDLGALGIPPPASGSSSRRSTRGSSLSMMSPCTSELTLSDTEIDDEIEAELADIKGMGNLTLRREKARMHSQFDTIKRKQIIKEAEDELADIMEDL